MTLKCVNMVYQQYKDEQFKLILSFLPVQLQNHEYSCGLYVMRCAIWYHFYNLKNMKNTHGGVLILVKLQAEAWSLSSPSDEAYSTSIRINFNCYKCKKFDGLFSCVNLVLHEAYFISGKKLNPFPVCSRTEWTYL